MHNTIDAFGNFLDTLEFSRRASKSSGSTESGPSHLRALARYPGSIVNKLYMPDLNQAQEEIPQLKLILTILPQELSLEQYVMLSSRIFECHFQAFLDSGDQTHAREAFEHAVALACMTGYRELSVKVAEQIRLGEFFLWVIMAYLTDNPWDFSSALEAVTELGTSAAAFLLSIHGLKTLEDFYQHSWALQSIPLPYPKLLFHVLSAVVSNSADHWQDGQETIFAAIVGSFEITPMVIDEMKDFGNCLDTQDCYHRCIVLHYIFYARFLGSSDTSELYESLDYRMAANSIFPHPLDRRIRLLDLKFIREVIRDKGRWDKVIPLCHHYRTDRLAQVETETNVDVVHRTIAFTNPDGDLTPSIQRAKVMLASWKENGYNDGLRESAIRAFEQVASHPTTTDEDRQIARWWLAFIRSNPDPHALDSKELFLEVMSDSIPELVGPQSTSPLGAFTHIMPGLVESWPQRAVKHTAHQLAKAVKEGNLSRLVELKPLLQETAANLNTSSKKSMWLNEGDLMLCATFQEMFNQLTPGEELRDLDRRMISHMSEALTLPLEEVRARAVATKKSSFSRLQFARDWAQRSSQEGLPESLDAFHAYASLLQDNIRIGSMAERKLQILTSEVWVQHWSDTAVTAVVRHGGFDRLSSAVEFLEQNRSITYRHLFQLRQSNPQLGEAYPDLAKRLLHLTAMIRDVFQARTQTVQHLSAKELQAISDTIIPLELSHDALLQEIRKKPGFEDFLRPLGYDQLSKAAAEGPVIMLTSDPQTDLSHVLIILSGREQPVYLQLPDGASFSEVSRRSNDMTRLVGGDGRLTRRGWELDIKPSDDDSLKFQHILEWLWDYVVCPIFETLHTVGYTSGRVWWCPSGKFTVLPLHAAALLDPHISLISSYTPSLEALINSRRRGPASDDTMIPRQFAVIGLQSCPRRRELQPLYAIKDELGFFFERGRDRHWTEEGKKFEGSDAQVGSVLDAMKSSHIVHLACHGVQDASDPLNNHLILHDGDLSLRAIMDENLPCAEFAFLSACQTATGHRELENESVHLAGGFIAAGFKGVIGTIWSIADKDALRVVRKVYEWMTTQDGGFDVRKAPEGLHRAVQGMIKQGLPPRRWAPFIHVGI